MAITVAKKPGRARVHASDAEKQAAYLERKGKVQCNVTIAKDVNDALSKYIARQQKDGVARTKSETVEFLLRTQLLRKR
jgi:hypothetical protein